jgi:hypothetical protein
MRDPLRRHVAGWQKPHGHATAGVFDLRPRQACLFGQPNDLQRASVTGNYATLLT